LLFIQNGLFHFLTFLFSYYLLERKECEFFFLLVLLIDDEKKKKKNSDGRMVGGRWLLLFGSQLFVLILMGL
jgi:hypothetical protein